MSMAKKFLNNKYKDDIIDFTNSKLSFLEPNDPFYLDRLIWHVINNDYEDRFCKNCGGPVIFHRQRFYPKYCSSSCSSKGYFNSISKEVMDEKNKKMKKTNMEKYGVDIPSKLDIFNEKRKETCMARYGFDNAMKNKEIQSKQFKKMQYTNINRYGVKSTLSLDSTKDKIKKTLTEKYGSEYTWLNPQIFNKARETTRNRYGDEFYSRTNDWMERFVKHDWGNKYYDYIMPSGKTYRIQGYEKYAVDNLLERKEENDIILDSRKPIIEYEYNGCIKIYKPDILLNDENKIIEVKSKFTYDIERERNEAKAKGAIDSGYLFEFWIIDRKGRITIDSR